MRKKNIIHINNASCNKMIIILFSAIANLTKFFFIKSKFKRIFKLHLQFNKKCPL